MLVCNSLDEFVSNILFYLSICRTGVLPCKHLFEFGCKSGQASLGKAGAGPECLPPAFVGASVLPGADS